MPSILVSSNPIGRIAFHAVSASLLAAVVLASSPVNAQTPQAMFSVLQSQECPTDLEKYNLLNYTEKCGDFNTNGKTVAEENKCINDVTALNQTITAYNAFMDQCTRKKDDKEKADKDAKAKQDAKADPMAERLKKQEEHNRAASATQPARLSQMRTELQSKVEQERQDVIAKQQADQAKAVEARRLAADEEADRRRKEDAAQAAANAARKRQQEIDQQTYARQMQEANRWQCYKEDMVDLGSGEGECSYACRRYFASTTGNENFRYCSEQQCKYANGQYCWKK